jgi:arylsulfatase B
MGTTQVMKQRFQCAVARIRRCTGLEAIRKPKKHEFERVTSSLSLLTAALALAAAVGSTQGADGKPNIVYIVADDLGWKDVGFHDAVDIKTPTLDRLAADGARLEQFYVQPVCSPTRAALMTGRYPFRYGLQTMVIEAKATYGLALDEYLLPQILKAAGYHTAMVGKWHLGHADKKFWPQQRGFDYFYGVLRGAIDYFTRESRDELDWQRNGKPVREKGYVTQLLGKDAVRVISEHNAKTPLFLYLAFTAPHLPREAPKEYIERYKNIEDPMRRIYAAQITCMDEEIGKVIVALDKKKIRENTLIIFHSDNGGTKSKHVDGEDDVSKIKIPGDNGDNGELNGGKGELYEGGTRVPAFVNWPGHIKPGSVVIGMVHVVDMLPTLAKLAAGSTEKCNPLDGHDVWPAIAEGEPTGRDELVYNIEPFRAAVRQGDWKLVWNTALPSKVELFNLAEDPNEKTNLADKQPEKVKQLKGRIEQLASESVKPLFTEAGDGGLTRARRLRPRTTRAQRSRSIHPISNHQNR